MNAQAHTPDLHESRFIDAARMLMICGLVWHHLFEIPGSTHSPRLSLQGVEHVVPELVNSFVHMAMMAAVPMLSVISGFLFFRRAELDYPRLFRSRLRTVALASWSWCALWLAFGWLAYLAARGAGWLGAPGLGWLDYEFGNPNALTVINGIFAVTREPFAYQFWFIRDLLITIALAPFIYFFLRRFGGYLLVLIAAFWVVVPDPPLLFSSNVPMFFTLGAWLALPRGAGLAATLYQLERFRGPLLGALALALLLRIFAHRFGTLESLLQGYQYLCLLRVLGVLGIGAALSAYVRQRRTHDAFFVNYGCYTFFIFAVHYPLIEVLQLGVLAVPGHATTAGMLLSWLLVPLVTIGSALVMAIAMEYYLPTLFNILNGGRGRRAVRRASAERQARARFRDWQDPAPDTR